MIKLRREKANTKEERRQSYFRWRKRSPPFSLINIKLQYNECIYYGKKQINSTYDDLAHAG